MSTCSTIPKKENLEILFYMVKKKGTKPIIFKSTLDELENPKTQIRGVLNKQDFMEIIIELFSQGICKDNVSRDFIEEEDFQTKNHLFMILLDKQFIKKYKDLSIGQPIGFLVGRTLQGDFYGNPSLECYLDLVCSCPGTGSYLIDYFIRYSETNGYNAVSLSSLDNVITYYYSKYGFENRHSCVVADEPVFIPSDELIEKMKGEYRVRKSLIEKPMLFNYLETLRQSRFGKKDENCDVDMNPILTPEDYIKYRCSSEGWMMRRCNYSIPIKVKMESKNKNKKNRI